jgi:hypothetical protein
MQADTKAGNRLLKLLTVFCRCHCVLHYLQRCHCHHQQLLLLLLLAVYTADQVVYGFGGFFDAVEADNLCCSGATGQSSVPCQQQQYLTGVHRLNVSR